MTLKQYNGISPKLNPIPCQAHTLGEIPGISASRPLEGEMNYAKALAVGVATGLLAVVLEFVVGIVSMMVQTAAQAGDGGGIAGFSVNPVPSFIIGFLAGLVWTLWRARLCRQTP